jgi:hypothetical protein
MCTVCKMCVYTEARQLCQGYVVLDTQNLSSMIKYPVPRKKAIHKTYVHVIFQQTQNPQPKPDHHQNSDTPTISPPIKAFHLRPLLALHGFQKRIMTRIVIKVLRMEAPNTTLPVIFRRPVHIPPVPQRPPRHVAMPAMGVVEQVLLHQARVETPGQPQQRQVVVKQRLRRCEDEEPGVAVSSVLAMSWRMFAPRWL